MFDPSKITTIYGVIAAVIAAILFLIGMLTGDDKKKWIKRAIIVFSICLLLFFLPFVTPPQKNSSTGGTSGTRTTDTTGDHSKNPDSTILKALEDKDLGTFPIPNVSAPEATPLLNKDKDPIAGTFSFTVVNKMPVTIRKFHIHIDITNGANHTTKEFTYDEEIPPEKSVRLTCLTGPFDFAETDRTQAYTGK